MTQDVLAAGDAAPDFTAPRDGGETVTLSDLKGKSVVLYFYPRDDTPGCTTEAVDFSALMPEFQAQNTVIIGVSRDSVAKHDRFRDKHDLKVMLVADETGKITEDYGVWVEKKMYGKTSMGIERATFLIDDQGIVQQIWRKVKAKGHAAEVLDAVRAAP